MSSRKVETRNTAGERIRTKEDVIKMAFRKINVMMGARFGRVLNFGFGLNGFDLSGFLKRRNLRN
jgi:hypothetical protein